MRFGLDDSVIEKLTEVFEANPKVDKAYIFGSRAKGNFRADSDIDIAIKGYGLTLDDILKMSVAFEDKGINYKIDLLYYNEINEPALIEHIDRVGVEFYSSWKEAQLAELIDIKHGYAFEGAFITTEHSENILVTPGNFNIGGGFKQDKFKYYTGEIPENYILKPGEIIATMTDLSQDTDTLGYSAKVPNQAGVNFLHNQRIGLLKFISNKADREFIYWLMRSKDYQGFIVGSSSGTSIMHTSPKRIKEYTFLLPPLIEQKSIATILSALDNKIDLLHRQNKTLEQLAETLFRQWFVKEAEEDWEERKLRDFGDIVCGKTPRKSVPEYFNGDIPFIKIPDMHGQTFVFDSQDSLTDLGRNSQIKKTLPPKSICVSCIATVGLVIMNAKTAQTNQQINSIIPKKDFYRYYLYLKMQSLKDELRSMASGGTATDNLNTSNFATIKIILPKESVLKKFEEIINPVFEKIFINQTQIRSLTKMRDTLLPKLMSGEVRVKMPE